MIKKFKSIFLLLFIFYSSSVFSESKENDLYNNKLLEDTRQQISVMSILELDEFRDYLSSCGTNAGGDIKRFFCERSARAYILKYGQNKSAEKLILAMAEVEYLIDFVDLADEQGHASETMKIRLFKDLDRYVVIREMMESAIKKAYLKSSN